MKFFNQLLLFCVFSLVQNLAAQTGTVTGLIVDENSDPLIGVSIIVKNTSRGTTTDLDGNYAIDRISSSDTLIYSYTGYRTEVRAVNNQTVLDLVMILNTELLDEIVVTGYGKQKKSSITSSVASIETGEIKQSPVANLSNALAGRLAGLISVQRSGEPGYDGAGLLIRGRSTTGDNSALVLVDGIPRSFSQLNSSEIASITVLKDAAAAAQYGARAANGVILITTKRGNTGKPTITYEANYGLQEPVRLPRFLGSYDYAVLYNEARQNAGDPIQFTDEDLNKYKTQSDPDNYPDTDWLGETLRDISPMSNQSLGLNGGTESIQYFVNLGALSQDGLVEATKYKRYNFRSNIDADVVDNLRMSLNLSGRSERRNFPGTGASTYFSSLLRVAPIFPAYYSNGDLAPGLNGQNAIGQVTGTGYARDVNDVFETLLTMEYQIPSVEGLSLKAYGSYDRFYRTIKNFQTPFEYSALVDGEFEPRKSPTITSLSESLSTGQSILLNGQINYQKVFGIHEIGISAIAEQQSDKFNNFNAFRNNFITTTIDQLFAGDAETQTNSGSASEAARRGYIGRITYAYANKIFVEGTIRRDGSDIFPKDGRWGTFPSVSLGWRLSEEAFWSPLKSVVNDFKLRVSHGSLGNDRVGRFRYLSAFNLGTGYILGGSNPAVVQGVFPTGLPNPKVTWEKSTQTNIGADAELFDGQLSFELDLFKKNTTDILASRNLAVPSTFGAGLPLENIGEVENKGFEFVSRGRKKISNINTFLTMNITYAKNKILFIDEPEDVADNLKRTGREIGQRFGLKALGLFQNETEIESHADQGNVGPGDIKYDDFNGDGVINEDDRVPIGNSDIPRWIYGLSAGFEYKGFDFSTLFQGAAGFSVYLSQEAAFAFFNGGKVLEDHLDRWTPDNPDATTPRVLLTSANNERVSSYWMKDASYIRWKNVEIGYNLPSSLTERINLRNVRLFSSALNILTFTDKGLKNFDPEAPSGRGWFYPQQRVFNFGISITL